MHNFTRAISMELKPFKNITVQLVSPLFVATDNWTCAKSFTEKNILVANVDTYTKNAVTTLGRTDRTTGYWFHGIQVILKLKLNQFFNLIRSFNSRLL